MGLTRITAQQISNIDYKQAVRVVTTTNITLAGGAPNTVDSVSLVANDRVLVTGQTTGSQNGLYYVTTVGAGSTGTWTRSTDGDNTGEILAGLIVMVTEGTVYADTQWKLTTNDPITIGTTALTFVQNYFANSISSGTSNVSVGSSANVTISAAGTANILTISSTGTVVSGTESVTGNITGGNVLTGGLISSTGNITGGNILTGGLISATGNLTAPNITISGSANISTFIGNVFFGSVPAQPTWYTIAPLNLNNSLAAATKVQLNLINTGGGAGAGSAIDFYTYQISVAAANAEARIAGIDDGNYAAYLSLQTKTPGSTGTNNLVERVKIDSTGASVVANITGGNILTAGLMSATSTITSAANITGGNVLTGGIMSSTGNATHGNILTGGIVSSTGNITGGNISATAHTGTSVSVTGTVTAASVVGGVITGSSTSVTGTTTAASVVGGVMTGSSTSVTGTTTAASVVGGVMTGSSTSVTGTTTAASVVGGVITGSSTSVTGTTTAASVVGGVITGSSLSVTGNITGGNVLGGANVNATTHTGATVSVTGNITGGNIASTGLISTTGNIAGGNILSNNYYYANGQAIVFGVNYTAATTPPSAPANGWQWYNTATDVLYEYLSDSVSQYWVDVSSPAFAAGVVANVAISGSMLVNANASYDIGSSSQTFRNVYAQNYYGNGATLTGIITSVSNINNGTSNMTVVSSGGNIAASVGGTSNVMVIASSGVTASNLIISGNLTVNGNTTSVNYETATIISASGNITGANFLTGGLISATGNVNVGNLINAGLTSVTGNITGGNLTTAGILTVNSGAAATAIVNGAGNAVGNIGSSSVFFNRLFAQATTALYADLAENYLGDADYTSGTVLDFGGNQEVTISTVDSSKRVAGVVSTNPAHLMNAGVVGEHVVTVALIGRVPVSVTGTVRKGDLMVSAGDGTARAVTIASPKVGTIIGKSLEDFDGDKGTIEIVIGKH